MTRVVHSLTAIVLGVALFAGCSDQNAETNASDAASTPAPGTTADAASFTGTIAETMDAGGYTYVRLESGNESAWAAGPQTPVTVGSTITVSTKMNMPGFRSESLDRTFDQLYFVSGFEAAEGTDPHAGMDSGDAPVAAHGAKPTADVAPGSVSRVEGGHTVAELFATRTELAGQRTTVRGRVVKFNADIMGRNWVHLQDGSGDADASTHDLLVTTEARCEVGDVITATGTVTVDKDFGAGYAYELLLEDATVEVEPGTNG